MLIINSNWLDFLKTDCFILKEIMDSCHHKTYDSKEMNSKMHSISLSINNSYVPEKIKSKSFMIAEDLAKVIETM